MPFTIPTAPLRTNPVGFIPPDLNQNHQSDILIIIYGGWTGKIYMEAIFSRTTSI